MIVLRDCFEGVALEDYVQFNWGILWGCLIALGAVCFGECVAGAGMAGTVTGIDPCRLDKNRILPNLIECLNVLKLTPEGPQYLT